MEKRGKGRPTKFDERIAARILELATTGKTDAQIAKAMGIAVSTLSAWKAGRPDFSDALKDAKGIADDLVEIALFQRALGYRHPALKIQFWEGRFFTQKYIEHYPPDTGAAMAWLKNRRPKRWRERRPDESLRDSPPPTLGYKSKAEREAEKASKKK